MRSFRCAAFSIGRPCRTENPIVSRPEMYTCPSSLTKSFLPLPAGPTVNANARAG
jgi:hypothetical protein